jgi:hypothetical protein
MLKTYPCPPASPFQRGTEGDRGVRGDGEFVKKYFANSIIHWCQLKPEITYCEGFTAHQEINFLAYSSSPLKWTIFS